MLVLMSEMLSSIATENKKRESATFHKRFLFPFQSLSFPKVSYLASPRPTRHMRRTSRLALSGNIYCSLTRTAVSIPPERKAIFVLLVTFSHQAHPLSLCAKRLADKGFAALDDHVLGAAFVRDFHAHFIAGANLVLELHIVHRRKEEQTSLIELFLQAKSRTAALRHRLNQDNARHNRILREMPLKEKILVRKSAVTHTSVLIVAVD